MIYNFIICTITTFSEPFKRLAESNKILKIIGSLGLLPGFILAAIVGYFSGEITWNGKIKALLFLQLLMFIIKHRLFNWVSTSGHIILRYFL